MKCPRCQSIKIDASGMCMTCGYEVSQWKKKLEQRLHAIRRKEEEIEQNLQSIIDAAVSSQPEYSSTPKSENTSSMPLLDKLAFLEPDNDEPVLDLFVKADHDALDVSGAEYTDDAGYNVNPADISDVEDSVDIDDIEEEVIDDIEEEVIDDIEEEVIDDIEEEVIDDIEDVEGITDDEIISDAEVFEDNQAITEEVDIANADNDNYAEAGDSPYILNETIPEGRLIFLSRTLSGLVDLFLIVIFTVVILCMADFFTDTPMLNSINAISFSTLFLMIYFLYSIFLLGTNGQTIGMIMTDLRIVSAHKKPLLLSQVIRRSAAFLVSLFGLGIGLLTGVISSECLCLHDRLSETRVIRII